jgi:hypothetical protein
MRIYILTILVSALGKKVEAKEANWVSVKCAICQKSMHTPAQRAVLRGGFTGQGPRCNRPQSSLDIPEALA